MTDAASTQAQRPRAPARLTAHRDRTARSSPHRREPLAQAGVVSSRSATSPPASRALPGRTQQHAEPGVVEHGDTSSRSTATSSPRCDSDGALQQRVAERRASSPGRPTRPPSRPACRRRPTRCSGGPRRDATDVPGAGRRRSWRLRAPSSGSRRLRHVADKAADERHVGRVDVSRRRR